MLKSAHFLLIIYLLTRIAALLILKGDIRSIDLLSWEHVAEIFWQGGNPYAETPFLNWPPFWPITLLILRFLSEIGSLDLIFLIRVFLVLTEAFLLWISYKYLTSLARQKAVDLLFLIYILCPIPILLVTVHCNFDVLVG